MVDLRDFATQQYPVAGNGATDATPAWNAALAALKVDAFERTLHLPAGNFLFSSPPDEVTFAANIEGEGLTTRLIRGYAVAPGAASRFIKWTGGDEVGSGSGGSIKRLMIDGGAGQGGVGFWAQCPAESLPLLKGPHSLFMEYVHVVCGFSYPNAGYWNYGFNLDGTLNANPPAGVANGIRNTRMAYCSVGQFANYPYLFDTCMSPRSLCLEAWAGYNVPADRYVIAYKNCQTPWNLSPIGAAFI